MSARVDIANIALALLSSDSITTLEDDSRQAKVINTHYEAAKNATLEAYEWSFATKRFTPAKSSTDPDWGWSNAFPIPSDILRVTEVDLNLPPAGQSIFLDPMDRSPAPHVVENRIILTNDDPIYCTGIRKVEDEGIFSALFDHAFAAKLAMLSCYAITESNTKFKAMATLYGAMIGEAKTRDAQQSTTRRLRHRRHRRNR